MKHLLLTTIAAVVLVGCGESTDISIWKAAADGNIEVVKQHLDAGTDVDAKDGFGLGRTPLHFAAREGHKKIVELLIDKGADMNAKDDVGDTPVDWADNKEIANLLRKHGGKTDEE